MDIVYVECINTYDPPVIRIHIGDSLAQDVSTGFYEGLRRLYPDLPPNPCTGE